MVFESPKKLIYLPNLDYGDPNGKMGHLACFMGGLFALGAQSKLTSTSKTNMKLAHEITKTCYLMYNKTSKLLV